MRGCSKSLPGTFRPAEFYGSEPSTNVSIQFPFAGAQVSKPRRGNISPELGMVPASNCAISPAGTMKSDDIGVHATLKCNP